MKRVFIIHGWAGLPSHGWYPWIEKELRAKGFDTYLPEMPNTDAPEIKEWVSFIAKLVKKADKDTYFIGHSIGCQAVLRYLQTIKEQIGGVVFVAGWYPYVTNLTGEEEAIAKPWVETPIDFVKIRNVLKKSVAIFSSDDPYVPLDNIKTFKVEVVSKIVMQKKSGHFTQDDGCKELPIALKELLGLMK